MVWEAMLVALAALLAAALWWDFRERRIPNALTVSGCVVALALRAAGGLEPLADGFLALFLAIAVSLPFVALGGLGGGDAKLLAAVGAFLGLEQLVVALPIIAIAGAILAVMMAVRNGVLYEVVLGAGELVGRLFGFGRERPRKTLSSASALAIPYALPIACGALAAWFA